MEMKLQVGRGGTSLHFAPCTSLSTSHALTLMMHSLQDHLAFHQLNPEISVRSRTITARCASGGTPRFFSRE